MQPKKRYLLILSIIDVWKQAATSKNVKSGWEKVGIYRLNEERVLNNVIVWKTKEEDLNQIYEARGPQINGIEITTFEKRIELSRHFYKIPSLQQIFFLPLTQISYITMASVNNAMENIWYLLTITKSQIGI